MSLNGRRQRFRDDTLSSVSQEAMVMPTSRFRFGSFELDISSKELRKNGLRIRIEDQPFRILWLLVSRQGDVVTREQLRQELWNNDTHVDFDRSLTRAINKVRLAMSDSASNPRFVETLPRRGYRFVAPVTLIGEASDVSPTDGTTGVPEHADATPLPVLEHRPWMSGFRRAAVVLTLAAALAAIAIPLARRMLPRRISAIAVLPFHNLSDQGQHRHFGDAMTDQLIATFSRIPSVRVVSLKSVMHYKGSRRSLPDIASELNVDSILDGSLIEAGDTIRMNVRLIQFPGERTLWTRSYERNSSHVLALQADLARSVAAEIGAIFPRHEELRLKAGAREVDPEVHALYLQGRLFAGEPARPTIERGIQALEAVLEREPGHAGAWAALADGWFSMSSIYMPPVEAMPKAKAAARKAIELDPESDAAHAVLGRIHVFYDWDWQAGGEQLQKPST
jgi:TolB-like protein/DNA-binding winged helix-turn-helix (wHTH) protein